MRSLIERASVSSYLILVGAILAVLLMLSCEESTGPETGTTAATYKLMIYAEQGTITTNGGSTRVYAKVYAGNDTTNTITGANVSFSATQAGTSTTLHVENSQTDSNGYASARVYAGSMTGTIAVTASVQVSPKEKYSDTYSITVIQGASLVSASPDEILADGISQSTITVSVVDSLGQPLFGAVVTFVTTAGIITPQTYSGEAGKATGILRSTPSVSDISATVTATSMVGKIAKITVDSDHADKPAKSAGTIGSATVLFKGITISGTIGKETVLANSADSTTVTVTVTETTTGDAVYGAHLTYTTNLGTLRAASGVTDTTGTAEVVLFGATVAGDATVTVALAEGLSFTTDLTLVKEIVMLLTSNPSVLSANGNDLSAITASLKDVDGNPIQGATVYFNTTDGVILPSAVTDEWGEATVNLRSSRYNAIAQVTAKYHLVEKVTNVEFSGSVLSLLATPLILFADDTESAKLTITFTDASSAPIVDEVVSISTSLGTLHASDGVTVGESIVDSTSTEGKIIAYITSDQPGNALISVSAIGSEDTLSINFTNYTFSLIPDDTDILAGGLSTNITASLRDIDGNITPITLEDITFSTTLGTIGDIAENTDGTILAELISGNSAGTATVSASITEPPVTSTTSVNFNAADAGSIVIRTERPTVKIGGSAVSIEATVFDETGNPKAGETVTFSIITGPGGGEEITPGTAVSDERGRAVVSFVTGISGSERDGVEIQARLGSIVSNSLFLTISGEPKSVKIGYGDSYTENPDGTYSVTITAIVSDVNRNKVVDGTIVNFSLEGAGVIAGQVPTVEGVASTDLVYSRSDAGKTVELTAAAGGEQEMKSFTLPGFKPAYFAMTAEPTSTPADGGKTPITITVRLFDGAGQSEGNIPDGTIVSFTTEAGMFTHPIAKSLNGVAVTQILSDKTPARIKITAKSGDYEDFLYVFFEEVGTTINGVTTIELSVDNPVLRADGISSTFIRARLKSFDGSVILTPTTVLFETDLGEITESVLSSSDDGVAIAQFSSNQVGTARIKVSVGAAFDYINVFLVPGPPLSIDLEFSPTSVGVMGSGRNTTLLVTADVKDDKNNAVADSNLVQFELVGFVDSEASLSPSLPSNAHVSEPVPTVNGAARVSFHAGTISGTVRIRARIVDENGDPVIPAISSETTEFQVFAGPPFLDSTDWSDPFTQSRMTVAGSPLNIYAGELNSEYSRSQITVLIGDRYQNPVPEGTAVYFTTTGGIVSTEQGFTNEHGLCTNTLYAGNPFPTLLNSSELPNPNVSLGGPVTFQMPRFDFDGDGNDNNGICVVSAYSDGVDVQGNQVKVWDYVPIIFSLDVTTFEIEVEKTFMYIGETIFVTITIHDINGNPIAGGSMIKIDTAFGGLSTSQIETDSPGTTTYRVALTNNLDPAVDKAGDTVVNVTLESPNGNITDISEPVFMSLLSE